MDATLLFSFILSGQTGSATDAGNLMVLMQRSQLIKAINISAYKIILTHVYKHLSTSPRTFAQT